MKNHLIAIGMATLLVVLSSQLFSQDTLNPTQIQYPGLVPFKAETGWGYMDAEGVIFEQPFLDSASLKPLSTHWNKAWLTWKKGKVGLVNKRYRIFPKYDDVRMYKSLFPLIEGWGGRKGLFHRDFSGELIHPQYHSIVHLGSALFAIQEKENGPKGLLGIVSKGGKSVPVSLFPIRYKDIKWSEFKKELTVYTRDSVHRFLHNYNRNTQVRTFSPIESKALAKPDPPKAVEYVETETEAEMDDVQYHIPVESYQGNDFADEEDDYRPPARKRNRLFHYYFNKEIEEQYKKSSFASEGHKLLIERIQKQVLNNEAYSYRELKEADFHFLYLTNKRYSYLMVLPADTEIEAVFSFNQLIFKQDGISRMYYAESSYLKPLFSLKKGDEPVKVSNLNLMSNRAFFVRRNKQLLLMARPYSDTLTYTFTTSVKKVLPNPADPNSVLIEYKKGKTALLAFRGYRPHLSEAAFNSKERLKIVWPYNSGPLNKAPMLVGKYDETGALLGYYRSDGKWLGVE